MSGYLMGIDIGTTGVNAMLFDTKGNAFGGGYREYPSVYPAEHQVEQDAGLILESAFEVCRLALQESGINPDEILAVSMTSQRATFGLLDAEDNIIGGHFYSWQDNRAISVLSEIETKIDPEKLYQTTGMPLTPTYSLEKLYWIKKHQTERYDKTEKVVFPADYVMYKFGADALQTELTCACCSGMINAHTLEWAEDVLDALDLDISKLSNLVKPGSVVGKVSQTAADRSGLAKGTLLVTGTGDQQSAAIGGGVIDQGRASLTHGTAGLLVVGTRELELSKSRGLMATLSGKLGLYELEGIQLGAASCYRWLRNTFYSDQVWEDNKPSKETSLYKKMDQLAMSSKPGANGVIFLPFLSGAGYPHWDPMAGGMFAGLRFSHTPADMMRAVIEGVALESFDMYEKMKEANVVISSLAVTGGAMVSPLWRQTIADIFEMEIHPLQVPNATLVGASIFAGIGAGVFKDVADGVAETVRFAEPVQPIAENSGVYRERYKSYKHLCAAIT
ncbi:MAG: FGGY family carbohydrate kinase [Kiritimatiellae bacterium]|nr:FGGY family carbohydrate kinase [Kiritimatiellia bacterium]